MLGSRSSRSAQRAGTWIDKRLVDRTFADLVEVWRSTRGSELSMSAAARYDQVLRVHLMPALGTTPVSKIDRERVRSLLATLKRTETLTTGGERSGKLLAPASVRKILTVLSAVMSEAVELGIVLTNPCTRMRGLPTIERPADLPILDTKQIEALAAAVPARDRTFILTAAYTGARAGECRAPAARPRPRQRPPHHRPRAQGLDGQRARLRAAEERPAAIGWAAVVSARAFDRGADGGQR